MHEITIYRQGSEFVTLKLESDSVQLKKIMAENQLQLTFYLNFSARFAIGDTCTVFDEEYVINQLPAVDKQAEDRYQFNLIMESINFDLRKALYLFLGSDNTLTQPNFSLIGEPLVFIKLIIENMNRIQPDEWQIGQVMINVTKNLTFANVNCYDALVQIANEFELEFFLENKTIHLTKRFRPTGYTFRYGKGYGLTSIQRVNVDNSNVVTRLYAFGSDKNLPADYRNYTAIRLQLAGATYIEKNVELYGVIEGVKTWDDIYPQRTGTVTGVSDVNYFTFTDSSIDFDVKAYLLPNTSAKITFNTGQLAGYTFEMKDFDATLKQFTIIKNVEEKAYAEGLPNSLLRITPGDTYVITDIYLPQNYIDYAEALLLAYAQDYLNNYSAPRVTYRIHLDEKYVRANNVNLSIGESARIIDAPLGLDRQIRITSTTRNLVNEASYDLEFSDEVKTNPLALLNYQVKRTDRNLQNILYSLRTNGVLQRFAAGDFAIQQGAFIAPDTPTISDGSGLTPLVMDSQGRIFRIGG